MAKPFDATLKAMLEAAPRDWPALAGRSARAVDVIDADVSTVTAAADKVLLLHDAFDSIMHLEFQSGPDAALPSGTHVYNALLEDRHGLLVRSVVVLLRPEADLANLTGLYERGFPGEDAYLRFRYQVIRVWQLPPGPLLTGGLGTLPLAPISAVQRGELPGVIERMKQRLAGRRRKEAGMWWTATYV